MIYAKDDLCELKGGKSNADQCHGNLEKQFKRGRSKSVNDYSHRRQNCT